MEFLIFTENLRDFFRNFNTIIVIIIFFILPYFFLFYFEIFLCYSDKEKIKLSELSKEEIDSRELINYIVLPFCNYKDNIYGKTKLKYLRDIIISLELLFCFILTLILLHFIVN